jgi:protocatechuate 3,4-dioxygenase beta subunit
MKKTIHISIPEPCHEDWSKMTPTQKGKHCARCEKEVTDYTQKTDEQLVKLLSNNGASCGRFKKSQINRAVTLERKSTHALAPYAASLLIPLSLMNSLNTKASTTETKIENTFKSIGIGRMSKNVKKNLNISGFIKEYSGNIIHHVKVSIKETGRTVYSDENGAFKITCLSSETLLFEKENFETLSYKTAEWDKEIAIILKTKTIETEHDLGEPIITDGLKAPIEIEEQLEPIIKKDSASVKLMMIKGTITDSSGLPLPGVNIIAKGTTHGTQSDFDGNYALSVRKGQTLVYSYVGFNKQERSINESSKIFNLIMDEGETLGEVVMTGDYSISQSKSMVTKPDFYANEEEVQKRRNRYQNTVAFLKLKTAGKKDARKTKKTKRKLAKANLKNNTVIDDQNKISSNKEDIISSYKQITGTISDSSGLPLPGTNISIKETKNKNTQSDFDGLYSIKVKPGQTLVYKYIGFDKDEIVIDQNTQIDIEMSEGVTGNYTTVNRNSGFSTPVYYVEENAVANRKISCQNTVAYLKLKTAGKKEARKAARKKE